MSKQDLYKVLELEKTATDDEIKAAYKKLVKKWHPDKNPDNKEEATIKFREISEAYNILSDSNKRKTYDECGFDGIDEMNGMENSGFNMGGFNMGGFDPFSMFKNFFGKQNEEVPPIQIPISVTLEELYTGTKKSVKYERFSLCKECKSKGRIGNNVNCTKCGGKGMTVQRTNMGIMQSTCRDCAGKGVDLKAPKCKPCNGQGCIKENHTLNVNIPKGSSEKHPVIIQNEGNEIPSDEQSNGNTRSQVVIIISEQTHPKYNRGTVIKEIGKLNESNLMIEVKLTLEESLCGFEKKFTHLDNSHFIFQLNTTVRHGDVFVLKGKGMPYYNEDKKGDLIIKVSVEKTELSSEVKHKIWKLFSKNPYNEITKRTHNLINYEDYKNEMINEEKKENMKNRYKKRNDDEDDGQDSNPTNCTSQ
jgi:DnaJ-class molecular chaperone